MLIPSIHVEKLWGSELHIDNNSMYCGKILDVNEGFCCSVHYHKLKTETFHISSGFLVLEIASLRHSKFTPRLCIDDFGTPHRQILRCGDSIRLIPYTAHRFYSLHGSAKFIEFSTSDFPEDSYRLIPSGKVDNSDVEAAGKLLLEEKHKQADCDWGLL